MCNIYVVFPVFDNPLFEGLAVENRNIFETNPDNWRENYKDWQPKLLGSGWKVPKAEGNVREFNDFPCINLVLPAFSKRAVDYLGSILSDNGELLPVCNNGREFFFFNCTKMVDCIDLEKSETVKVGKGLVARIDGLVFVEEKLVGLKVFKIRTLLRPLFCTQAFVDKVHQTNLQGFSFVKIWPLPPDSDFNKEYSKAAQEGPKVTPFGISDLNIIGQSMVIRLFTARKKPTKKENTIAWELTDLIQKQLHSPNLKSMKDYVGNVEGTSEHPGEIRIHVSCPDSDALVDVLKPCLRTLPWPGKYQVAVSGQEWNPHNANKDIRYIDLS